MGLSPNLENRGSPKNRGKAEREREREKERERERKGEIVGRFFFLSLLERKWREKK